MSEVFSYEFINGLANRQYLALTAYRKSGQPVTTPVWFAPADGKIYIWTNLQSGKAKRIRNNGRVEIAACDMAGKVLGPASAAKARILPAGEDGVARDAMRRKYGLWMSLFALANFRNKNLQGYLEIAPSP